MKNISSLSRLKPAFCFLLLFLFGSEAYCQTWKNVGAVDFTTGHVQFNSLAIDSKGTPYIVFEDGLPGTGNNGKATVMKYDGSSWVYVGKPAFSDSVVWYTKIALGPNDTPYVSFVDQSGIDGANGRVMKFDGTGWITVGGTDFSTNGAYTNHFAIDDKGVLYDAYLDGASTKITVMKYDGASWTSVGIPEFSPALPHGFTFSIDKKSGDPYVAYCNSADSTNITVSKFNGTTWVNVGTTGFASGKTSVPLIAVDKFNTPYVSYNDFAYGGRLTAMKFNGSFWVNVGVPGFSADTTVGVDMVIGDDGSPFVLSMRTFDMKPTLLKFNGTSWIAVGNPYFSLGASGVGHCSLALSGKGDPYVTYNNYSNYEKGNVMTLEMPTFVPDVNENANKEEDIYPNPTTGIFSFSAVKFDHAALYNSMGQYVKEVKNSGEISIMELPSGIYFVKVFDAIGSCIKQKKLIKN